MPTASISACDRPRLVTRYPASDRIQAPKASPGGAFSAAVPFAADRAHLAAEYGGLQVEPGGEVPVEGADAHSRAPGDVLERRVGAPLGERGRGRRDQPGVVLPRVGAQLLGGPRR